MKRAVVLTALALAATVALPLAPSALAHGGSHVTFQQQIVGDTVVKFGFTSNITVSGSPMPAIVQLTSFGTGEIIGGQTLTGRARAVSAASAESVGFVLAETGVPGSYATNVTFPARGTWNVTLHATPLDVAASFVLDVYPPAPWVIESLAAASSVYYSNESSTVTFQVFDAKSMTAGPAPPDGVVRVEHWTDDHLHKLWEKNATLAPTGQPGEVALRDSFPEPGMYHMFVGAPSLGLAPGDRPMIHLYVLDQKLKIEDPPARTPAPDVFTALGAILMAGALVAFARRRL